MASHIEVQRVEIGRVHREMRGLDAKLPLRLKRVVGLVARGIVVVENDTLGFLAPALRRHSPNRTALRLCCDLTAASAGQVKPQAHVAIDDACAYMQCAAKVDPILPRVGHDEAKALDVVLTSPAPPICFAGETQSVDLLAHTNGDERGCVTSCSLPRSPALFCLGSPTRRRPCERI